jgi:alkylhydroperoxidase family enzyme
VRHAEALERVAAAILETPGDAPLELRRAAAAGSGVPPELEPYLAKVVQRAHTVVDADVAALRSAGYSEDAIFELTLAAALGAAQRRLERGLAVLGGDA